jgi:hypothetical protein
MVNLAMVSAGRLTANPMSPLRIRSLISRQVERHIDPIDVLVNTARHRAHLPETNSPMP